MRSAEAGQVLHGLDAQRGEAAEQVGYAKGINIGEGDAQLAFALW